MTSTTSTTGPLPGEHVAATVTDDNAMVVPERVVEIAFPEGERWISANMRGHWTKTNALRRYWRTLGLYKGRAERMKRGALCTTRPDGTHPVVAITATVCRPSHIIADAANIAPTVKAIIDGLVEAQLLPDDSDTYVTSTAFEARRGVPRALILRLTEQERP